jgi:predicted permease
MQAIPHVVSLTSPLFLLAFLGYALVRWFGWPKEVSDALTKFVFAVAIPAVLFRLMSDFSRLPPVDVRLLIAYFEWARTRHVSLRGFAVTVKNVARNPVVASLLVGTLWGWLGIPLPSMADRTLELIGQSAIPLSLIALGMGLGEFGVTEGWRERTAISFASSCCTRSPSGRSPICCNCRPSRRARSCSSPRCWWARTST